MNCENLDVQGCRGEGETFKKMSVVKFQKWLSDVKKKLITGE
jgi:hypothetical protein